MLFFCLPPPISFAPSAQHSHSHCHCHCTCVLPMVVALEIGSFSPFSIRAIQDFFECIAYIICALKCILQMSSLPQPYKYHVWWVCIPNNWVLYRHKKAFVCFLTYALQYQTFWMDPQSNHNAAGHRQLPTLHKHKR